MIIFKCIYVCIYKIVVSDSLAKLFALLKQAPFVRNLPPPMCKNVYGNT